MNEIIDHYDSVSEDSRLLSGWGQLEFARTQELILRHLQPPPAAILDVGGASGIYSDWLGSLGYTTHLIDVVPRHVERARQAAAIASAELGDARKLTRRDASVDAVLLLGPLYHLTERTDRLAALKEAHRVLRNGHLLFAAGISRFASLMDGLVRGFAYDPSFVPILAQDLENGQHRNPTGQLDYFTTAFFHHPEELKAEVAEAGFSLTELAAIEGPGWLVSNFEARWSDAAQRKRLLSLVRKVEHEPALLGVSPHLLAIGRKM